MKQLILFSGVLAGLAMAGTTVSAATTDPTANTKANVQIIDDETDDQLTITSAPDFDFGTVKALDIYNSFDKDSTNPADGVLIKSPLTVTDGRRQDIKGGWYLTTSLSAFSTRDEKNQPIDSLNEATITLGSKDQSAIDLKLGGVLTSEQPGQTVMTHTTNRGTLTLPADQITAKLHQTPTPAAKVDPKTAYQADLTWTLTPDVETRAL